MMLTYQVPHHQCGQSDFAYRRYSSRRPILENLEAEPCNSAFPGAVVWCLNGPGRRKKGSRPHIHRYWRCVGVTRFFRRFDADRRSLGTGDMPDREPVLRDLLDQMSLYPPDTVFFLNVWCFG